MSEFEAVIGLEIHVQLSTDSKIFATSSTTAGQASNTHTDPVTLGLPGCLPVLNKRAVDFAIRLGLATNCTIERESIFARKHYFYPDLPKGYQISQYEHPVCSNGHVMVRINGSQQRIGVTRIHLEEDAGKSIHLEQDRASLVDLNRSGVPLAELVTEPDFRSPEEAGAFMRQLRQIVRYLDICDGNMEEGSLRCDANISIRKRGDSSLGTKVELKNMNSFRFVEKALDFEIARQTAIVQQGREVEQETRLWDENKNATKSMRSKEYAEDYRYFPDPDLLPLVIDEDWLNQVKTSMPELPASVHRRFQHMYGLDELTSEVLSEEKLTALYFDQAVTVHNNPSAIANWVTTELFGRLNREGLDIARSPVSPENLALLVKLIDQETISGKIGKTVFDEMFATGASPSSIVQAKGLRQISDRDYISKVVGEVLREHPNEHRDYLSGTTKAFGFFVGQVMRKTSGRANPRLVNEVLKQALEAGEVL